MDGVLLLGLLLLGLHYHLNLHYFSFKHYPLSILLLILIVKNGNLSGDQHTLYTYILLTCRANSAFSICEVLLGSGVSACFQLVQQGVKSARDRLGGSWDLNIFHFPFIVKSLSQIGIPSSSGRLARWISFQPRTTG